MHNRYMIGHGEAAVLGIDLGTSGVKVLVTTPGGDVLGRASAGYPVSVPAPGRAEADPGDWWSATRRAVHAALTEARLVGAGSVGAGLGWGGQRRLTVTGLAVVGQMHGVVLVDERGAPLRPAILWLDQRATAEVALYQEMPCDYTAPLRNRPSPGMAGPLLCWLATHEPHTMRCSWWALQPKDWLRLRLTGQAATDPTDASGTLLFDLARNAWADPLIEKLGLPREKLPPVRGCADLGGHLLRGPAADLGLPAGIPVAVGAADTAAALFAAGLKAEDALLNLGSGGQWVVREDGFRPASAAMPAGTTNLYRAVGDGYYRLAPVQNVGVTLNWVRTLLNVSWADLYDAAARPPRADAPVFAPYLTPERWDPAATGAWTGLALAHQREDLLRSALDGVAGLLRERLDDLRASGHDPSSVILGGGGATHPAWRDLLAVALGVPLRPAPAA